MSTRDHAEALLRQMLGADGCFRPGQWEAIEAVALNKSRALVIQRTGWGKSLVYFLATKLLREQGAGPTMLISPLLSLMRNQILMAVRIGVRAMRITSDNTDEWENVEAALSRNECDILFVSPERLSDDRFVKNILTKAAGRIGLFVVDEAHCISDWGHDFRPDYRRIVRVLSMLPKGVPVLGTTATANNRVVQDVQTQLGGDLLVLRGPLARESLHLENIVLPSQTERLAWLVENLPRFKGSGIIYCLTRPDTERVVGFLKSKGFMALSYHAGLGNDLRQKREDGFLANKFPVIVATVALGMGFDKPDIGFVIHFQCPGSVIAYYQQVGRAGRALKDAYGIILSGREDDEIQEFFINTAFPPEKTMRDILSALEKTEGLTLYQLLDKVNCSRSVAEKALVLLEVDGAVGTARKKTKQFFRTPKPWQPDTLRIGQVLAQRRVELEQMREYIAHTGCLMVFLQRALDDPDPKPCGRCVNCRGTKLATVTQRDSLVAAEQFINSATVTIQPKRMWPIGVFPEGGRKILDEMTNLTGICLSHYGDAGWGELVKQGKYKKMDFPDELVEAAADLVRSRWRPEPPPEWITAIPSKRHPGLVSEFCRRLGERLGLPFIPALKRKGDPPPQKTMQNSTMQARNVLDTIEVSGMIPTGPVLLVDDIIDSGWTLTMAGWMLRTHGGGPVHPFAIASAAPKDG